MAFTAAAFVSYLGFYFQFINSTTLQTSTCNVIVSAQLVPTAGTNVYYTNGPGNYFSSFVFGAGDPATYQSDNVEGIFCAIDILSSDY